MAQVVPTLMMTLDIIARRADYVRQSSKLVAVEDQSSVVADVIQAKNGE